MLGLKAEKGSLWTDGRCSRQSKELMSSSYLIFFWFVCLFFVLSWSIVVAWSYPSTLPGGLSVQICCHPRLPRPLEVSFDRLTRAKQLQQLNRGLWLPLHKMKIYLKKHLIYGDVHSCN